MNQARRTASKRRKLLKDNLVLYLVREKMSKVQKWAYDFYMRGKDPFYGNKSSKSVGFNQSGAKQS